jgi:membrane protease subunit HflK
MLTGDLNVVDLEWIVQYRINNPLHYLFKVFDVERTIRDISEAVVRRIAGNRPFDEILNNRVDFANVVQQELQEILDSYETGIKVITVKLQDVNPPEAVKAAFNEVNEAIQDRERSINQAQETYNNQVPKARGEAERTIAKSEGYALERVNNAQGDVARFSSVLKEYNKAKRVTRSRLYLETLSNMLPRMREIYVVDGKQKALLPFLSIGKEKGVAK